MRLILLVIIAALTYLSCQREIYFDGISVGKLKKDAFGNCSPVSVGGSYKTDTALTITNFVDVQVDVSFSGTYEIRSDTINGYYFIGTGTVDKGLSTVRLFGKGKPNISGNNNFTVTYGNSFCNFYITVSPPSVAVFSLGGSPDSCTAATIAGNYIEGIALTTDNTITVQANVALPGLYTISASTNNGFQFLANGIFTASGLQNVTLKGTGKPIRAEVSNITVANIVSTCNFPVTVLSDTVGKAMFSFDGTPNTCINYTVNGNYYAGIAANGNSVTMNVTVTKPGSYYIITNTANGITFSNVGSFLSTGQQTVTLSATGNPINSGPVAFIPNTGTQSCSFLVNVQPLPPPALFTLSGSPSACAPVTVNGFYIHSKPLDAANTVVIQVDVSTPGSYSFSTNTVNGMTFSASGVFTATGLQNVTLHGSGTPQITGTTILTPRYSTSSCSFNVTVQ
ncbi:MAG TPA: hypothetical protein VET23_02035 [Chitinophagaceae bacterium]|nr:hypothetical protein [Chitinophagaceae bacterium]